MAIEKLGKNQYVYWEDLGKEGYDHILESEKLNEWLLTCTNEAELKEMVSGVLMHPLLQQHTQLIERNRSIIPRYRKVVVSGTHTAENHDFISSDQGSRSSISKFLLCSARSGNRLSR